MWPRLALMWLSEAFLGWSSWRIVLKLVCEDTQIYHLTNKMMPSNMAVMLYEAHKHVFPSQLQAWAGWENCVQISWPKPSHGQSTVTGLSLDPPIWIFKMGGTCFLLGSMFWCNGAKQVPENIMPRLKVSNVAEHARLGTDYCMNCGIILWHCRWSKMLSLCRRKEMRLHFHQMISNLLNHFFRFVSFVSTMLFWNMLSMTFSVW